MSDMNISPAQDGEAAVPAAIPGSRTEATDWMSMTPRPSVGAWTYQTNVAERRLQPLPRLAEIEQTDGDAMQKLPVVRLEWQEAT